MAVQHPAVRLSAASPPQQRIWYAIRRKSTGRFLPGPPAMQRGGQTHMSFESVYPPRLWPTAKGANVAMKLWLQGDWTLREGSYRGKVQFRNSRMHLEDDIHVVPVCLNVVDDDVTGWKPPQEEYI